MEEILITNYPLIIQLKRSNLTYSEISQILLDENNISITTQQLINFVNKVKNNKVHSEYANLLLLSYDLSDEVKSSSIEFGSLVVLHKSIIEMLPTKDYEPYILNQQTLSDLPDQLSMLYAKRLLNLIDLPDELLIQQQKEKNPKIEIKPLNELQDNIHKNIKQEAKNLLANVKTKYVKFLTTNISRIYEWNHKKLITYQY